MIAAKFSFRPVSDVRDFSFKFLYFPFPLYKQLPIIFLSLFNCRTKLLSCLIKKEHQFLILQLQRTGLQLLWYQSN